MTEVPTPQERKREQNYSGGWDASAEDFLLRTYTERSMLQPSWKCPKISVSLTAVLVAERLQWERQISPAAFSARCIVISAPVCSPAAHGSVSQPGPSQGRTDGFFVQRGPRVPKP